MAPLARSTRPGTFPDHSARPGPPAPRSSARHVSLCELLDRVLNKGAVLTGGITISVAEIELLYVGIHLLISSVETLLASADGRAGGGTATHERP